jgi:hypothetical protein
VIAVSPSKNSALPVGLPVPAAVIVAVWVTARPTTDGVPDAPATDVAVDRATTRLIDVNTGEALYVPGLKHWTVMVCGLAAVLAYVTKQEAVSEAVPLAGWAAHPEMVVPPSKSSSLPVRLPALGDLALTMAV